MSDEIDQPARDEELAREQSIAELEQAIGDREQFAGDRDQARIDQEQVRQDHQRQDVAASRPADDADPRRPPGPHRPRADDP